MDRIFYCHTFQVAHFLFLNNKLETQDIFLANKSVRQVGKILHVLILSDGYWLKQNGSTPFILILQVKRTLSYFLIINKLVIYFFLYNKTCNILRYVEQHRIINAKLI